MRKLILSTLLFLSCILSHAQKIQFCDPTNQWNMIDSTIGCCIPRATLYTTAYYDSTPYTYNGHSWQYLTSSVISCLTRQDSGRVYVVATIDSIERVLYDFNLEINDTLRTAYPQDIYVAWVTNLDSTQIDGRWYKVWHFEGVDTNLYFTDSIRPFSYNVIEGIGCTNGPYYPACPYSLTGFSQQLLCFKNDLNISSALSIPVASYGYNYAQFYDNNMSCTLFSGHMPHPVQVGSLPSASMAAKVLPNPVNESSRIVLAHPIGSGNLTIFDYLGHSIFSTSLNNQSEITIGNQINLPGIYYYRLTDNNTGETFSGKITRQ